MKQITQRHIDFLEEAKSVFENDIARTSHWNRERDLIALRYGKDRDCINIYELGDEIAFFAQFVTPTDGKKLLEHIGGYYDLELAEVRSEVADFGVEMEKQLKANEDKGGWENSTPLYLKNQLERNFRKLFSCISHSEFRRRCANIANFAMMLDNNDRREETERRRGFLHEGKHNSNRI